MQPTTANSAASFERELDWLAVADRHWSAGPITANEFAMHAVGSVLLHDIATAPATRVDQRCSPLSAESVDRRPPEQLHPAHGVQQPAFA
jgi:hypothetical protein